MPQVRVAPSAERDIRRILTELRARASEGRVSVDFPDRWFEEVEDGIDGLREFPQRHPYAPERPEWGRAVRNVLLKSGYRILFQMYGDTAWVMRVRHQRQRQLRSAGPGSGYPAE